MGRRRYEPEELARAAALPPPVDGTTVDWTVGQRTLIAVTPDCWHWTGRVDRDGYPRSTNGRLAHRLAFQYWVGPIPDGYHVDHACHNRDETCTNGATCMHRRCVRPDHLAARVAAENLADQYTARKARCKNGHKLTRKSRNSRSRGCRVCQPPSKPKPRPPRPRRQPPLRAAEVPLHAADDSTCEVLLKGGLVALIDAADWPLVSTFKWYLRTDKDHWVYARGIRRNAAGESEFVVMHRLVTQPVRGQRVYHRNRHGLDNRRANLLLGPAKTITD